PGRPLEKAARPKFPDNGRNLDRAVLGRLQGVVASSGLRADGAFRAPLHPCKGVRAAVDPREALHSFFESAYGGGSDLADWNREELAPSWRPEPATLRDLLGGLMDDSQIHGSIENLV